MTPREAALMAEVRELREELAEWRQLYGNDDNTSYLWRSKLGMAPQMVKALRLLVSKPGQPVRRDKILMAITAEGENLNMASVIVSRVRQRLSALGIKDAITSVWGHGYTITPEAAAKIREIVG